MRGAEPVELTPKGFELLRVFVENHGRLLHKDELMDKIWADSFVEESNLTFNIRQLRKLLGDDAQNPKYIKTVRGHGYRFIADVREISDEDEPAANIEPKAETPEAVGFLPDEPAIDERPVRRPKPQAFLTPVFLVFALLLISATVIGVWYVRNKSLAPHAPVLSAAFSSEKLTTNGKVIHAVISPDGQKVVYTNGGDGHKESVWLRQIDEGSNTEIIPPSDDVYSGLAFSPDGETLYFARRGRRPDEQTGIYRISIHGGIPTRIIGGTEGWMSISPDGALISFVRCPYRSEENCGLWIAYAADGRNEKRLAAFPAPTRIGTNKFSPDGKTIAFGVGQSENAANEFGLAEIDLESGSVRELTAEKFFNVRHLEWLPDKSGWLFTASRIPNKNSFIWQVSAATGEALPLTKDSEAYSMLSLDKNATRIVSTQFKENFRLRLLKVEDPSDVRIVADAISANFAPNGKIYFSSIMSGNDEIWSINADGSNQRQLTNTPADEIMPIVSPDNNTVFFTSNRSGAAHIWRMNIDGSDQTQVTQKEGGFPMFISPDGEWLYFVHGLNRTLWRVPTGGGGEQMVLNRSKSSFAFSPDGSQVAFSERQGEERILTIVSLADGQTVKTFPLADRKALLLNIVWMPDAKTLLYVSADRDYRNNGLWKQPLDAETPQKMVDLGDEELRGFGMRISADGQTLAIVQGEWLHDAVLIKGLR